MQKNSVLVVGDEAIVRESIAEWLRDAGYRVSTAESGDEALSRVKEQAFNVMILDLGMMGAMGLDVLREVKVQLPKMKFIVLTAYPSKEITEEAKKLGALDYIIKPMEPDESLEKLVHEALTSVGVEAPEPARVKKLPPRRVPEAPELKKLLVISKENMEALVEKLLKEMEVCGVKARHGKYVYDRIASFDELCLDYDVTINPPTRYLLPKRELMLRYKTGGGKVEVVVDETPRLLIGVHPYDIKAIELLDEAFVSANPDPNYIARRANTLIIGVDVINPSQKSFAPSMGTHVAESGFDLMLTDIGPSYVVTVGTNKGADLLEKYAQVSEPTGDEIAKQKAMKDELFTKYMLHLDIPRERLPKLLEEAYDDPYWEERSRTCLSCGSCVMVCPTCFCFDVKDEVSLNLKDGERYRQWDGCMLVDFAKVATGENFRHDRLGRFRHRIYRKGKYVIERYGKVGCVGCGRCASACLAEIASPLEAFNAIASTKVRQSPVKVMQEAHTGLELYEPRPAELVAVTGLTPREKVFEFRLRDGKQLGQRPGQFVGVSIYGIGEAPISVSSSPTRNGTFQLAVRNVGDVTSALHTLQPGAVVGIRGPFGNGFPLEKLEGKDILLIAGGIGLFPLRSLVQYILDRRHSFGKVMLLFGARSPAERVFTDELAAWSRSPDIELYETVDKGDDKWRGNVGVITTLIPKVTFDPKKTMTVVVGPPIMYRFVVVELKKRDLPDENIVMSLERRMKCGVGKCGHCQINGVYVCQEGPVFTLARLRNLREAL